MSVKLFMSAALAAAFRRWKISAVARDVVVIKSKCCTAVLFIIAHSLGGSVRMPPRRTSCGRRRVTPRSKGRLPTWTERYGRDPDGSGTTARYRAAIGPPRTGIFNCALRLSNAICRTLRARCVCRGSVAIIGGIKWRRQFVAGQWFRQPRALFRCAYFFKPGPSRRGIAKSRSRAIAGHLSSLPNSLCIFNLKRVHNSSRRRERQMPKLEPFARVHP